jgi:hypothetical protein
VLTHNPTGWGLAYTGHHLTLQGDGPTLHGDGWLGSWFHEPQDKISFRSVLAVKEFHLATPYFRPCVEAGVTFVDYGKDVLGYDPFFTSTQTYHVEHEHTVGVDIRLKALLAMSSRFGIELAVHSNFNRLFPYTSFDVGFALGCVRPKLCNWKPPFRR